MTDLRGERVDEGKMMDKVVCACGYKYESEFAKEDWATCPNCDMPIKYVDGIKKMRDRIKQLEDAVEWALNCEYVATHTYGQFAFREELKRRAGRE